MNSLGVGSRRHRLVSDTYEEVGRGWKEQLCDVSLAVYDECPSMEDIARGVAQLRRVENGSFYVMDASEVESRLNEWRSYLPFVDPFYSIQCNDDPLLLQLLTRSNDCNLQVSNVLELERALTLVSPSRIIFHSHLLTRKILRMITQLQEPLNAIVVDNEDSLIDSYQLNPYQPLILRVSLSPESEDIDLCMGMAIDEVIQCVPRLIREGVPLVGLSLQLMAEGVNMIERAQLLVHLLSTLSDCKLSLIDIGDGFHSSSMDQTSYLLDCIIDNIDGPIKLIATPGRFFAASAFSLVTSIVGKKAIDARAITRNDADGGGEGFVYETTQSIYGAFNGIMMGEKYECTPLSLSIHHNDNHDNVVHASAILGSALDHIDFPKRHTRLPSLAIGDCLLWKEMGAYGARDEDCVPVYYYTGRAHWERVKGIEDDSNSLLSDGGSDEGDYSDRDDDDMSECFGRVFMH